MSTESILLRPRPYARSGGRLLLLPLLSPKPQSKPLPPEIWYDILGYVFYRDAEDSQTVVGKESSKLSLLTLCKSLKDIALPLLYSHARIRSISNFEKFATHLCWSDQQWDSIRRIPYSTPGRWIHELNVSDIKVAGRLEELLLDTLLTRLFPLMPNLKRLVLNPSFVLSRRALEALASRDGAPHLRCLEGVGYVPEASSTLEGDPFVQLVKQCTSIEVLEIFGNDPDRIETQLIFDEGFVDETFTPLMLPRLHTVTLVSMHATPFMQALLQSSLPALRKLTISPNDNIPFTTFHSSTFIRVHGQYLDSLTILSRTSWPSRLHPSPPTLLETSPNLRHLSLAAPLPVLTLPPDTPPKPHPLQTLSIPRPSTESWKIVERLLPLLPSLEAVRFRDVRWLRHGMSGPASNAGVQGVMREWRRRLVRKNVKVLDADWKESP